MFGWLFGKDITWETSEAGNQIAVKGQWRVTVFKAKNPKGFAFCLVKGENGEPFFSHRFKQHDDAITHARLALKEAASDDPQRLAVVKEDYAEN